VLYSSFAAVIGSPGQSHYAGANAFLDALARYRAAMGQPATSIAWGAFAEVGRAAADARLGARMVARGVASLTLAEGRRALDRVLARPRANIAIAKFDARQWTEFHPAAAHNTVLAPLRAAHATDRQAAPEVAALRQVLLVASPGERRAQLEHELCQQLARVLRLDAEHVDRATAFQRLGVDSLTSLELRNRLEAILGIRLSATLLFTYATVATLAAYLSEVLGGSGPTAPGPGHAASAAEPAPPTEPAIANAELGDVLAAHDAEAVLEAELAALEEMLR
jgi:acyl carrier protein